MQGTRGRCRSNTMLLISQSTLRHGSAAGLQLLQLPSLLKLFQLPKMKAISFSCRPPKHSVKFGGLEALRVQHRFHFILGDSSLFLQGQFILVLPFFMSIFPFWLQAMQTTLQVSAPIPKKPPYTDCTTSIQNYIMSTSYNKSLILSHS